MISSLLYSSWNAVKLRLKSLDIHGEIPQNGYVPSFSPARSRSMAGKNRVVMTGATVESSTEDHRISLTTVVCDFFSKLQDDEIVAIGRPLDVGGQHSRKV